MALSLPSLIHQISAQLSTCCATEHEATQEAWLVLEKVMHTPQAQLLHMAAIALTPAQHKNLDLFLEQRVHQRTPLAYLLGSVPFCNLDIVVEPPILIPRPETEEWVSWLIEQLTPIQKEHFTILDLCTGSGCVALALAHAFPLAQVVGIDNNPDAVALANKNKKHNKITNVEFLCGDLYAALPAGFTCDLIVANPPYITEAEYKQLQPEVVRWEDKHALVAHDEGLEFYRRIAHDARTFLKSTSTFSHHNLPRIVVELGTAPESVVTIFRTAGYDRCKLLNDMQGTARWAAVCI
jgi:release factor glutamine methyltransferase